jgi:hypothetical protein
MARDCLKPIQNKLAILVAQETRTTDEAMA